MSWLAPGQLLVEERDGDRSDPSHTYFYAVDLRQATNPRRDPNGTTWRPAHH